jgi:hypothetical protein
MGRLVMDAVVIACEPFVKDDPVFEQVRQTISVEGVARGEMRAVDAQVVAAQLLECLPYEEPPP